MANNIPDGYIAKDSESYVWAVDSATLSKNGEVHGGGPKSSRGANNLDIGQTSKDLDPFVEFDIKGDPKLEALKKQAREIGKKYSDPMSSDYIANQDAREETIINKLGDLAHAQYGDYSEKTRKEGENQEERNSWGWFSSESARLADMEKGSLVCRHQAPIMSVLLHQAGIENHLLGSRGASVNQQSSGPDIRYIATHAGETFGKEDKHFFVADLKERSVKIIDFPSLRS